jgi:copper homeostasis protein
MMIKEFCAENWTHIAWAIDRGVNRIELCDNLAVGGTTPSFGVICQTAKYAHRFGITIMTMIRPRGGNFIYDETELAIMKTDITKAIAAGSDGLVFGCLNSQNEIDKKAFKELMSVSGGVDVVFHMAFDAIKPDKQFDAMDFLIQCGVKRILTHGGASDKNILETASHIRELVEYAAGRIEILAGGGVNKGNLDEVIRRTGVREVHGTGVV